MFWISGEEVDVEVEGETEEEEGTADGIICPVELGAGEG